MNMFAVGRLGSYISRGVNTVSGPFQGGAVDIIVVEQPDGSFKSSPWYVRFGKSPGALKADERVVNINVNGVDADFCMYLDNKGEAVFLCEGESEIYPSSGDDVDCKSDIWRTHKSKSCNFDANRVDFVSEVEASTGKIIPRTNSPRGRYFGLPSGRRSMKENDFREEEGVVGANWASSLEDAEMAANLLEVRWTTSLASSKNESSNSAEVVSMVRVEEGPSEREFSLNGHDENKVESSVLHQGDIASNAPDYQQSVCSSKETDEEIPCSTNPGHVETSSVQENYNGVEIFPHSSENASCNGNEKSLCNAAKVTVDDFDLNKEVIEDVSSKLLIAKNSNMEDSCNCENGPNNELKSQELYTCTNDLNSVPPVSNKGSSSVDIGRHPDHSGIEECLGDYSRTRNANSTPSEISEEEQFSFSDLDEPKLEKVDEKDALLPDGRKRCLLGDPSKSSEEQLTEIVTKDDIDVLHQFTDKPLQGHLPIDHPTPKVKHNSASSPISISKAHKNSDLDFFPPIVESLPNMPFVGDNINPDGIPDLLSRSLDSNFEALKMVNNDVQMLSESDLEQQQVAPVQPKTNDSHFSEEIKKIITDPAVEVSLCRHLLYEGMGYEAAALAFDTEKLDAHKFSSLCPDIVKDDKLVVRIGGLYFPWDAALPIASTIGSNGREQILEPKGMIAVGQSDITSQEGPQKSMNTRNGSWKIWPFSFRRSNTVNDNNLGSETASQSPLQKDRNEEVAGFEVTTKKKRAKAPTSEQLLSLNLKEGKNVVTFTFSTAMQENQQVDARIFLWKWKTRIVISDVDGTITKSDVLGQFMPLMGYDWSQTGVTRLFSAIKENGYHLLFLSARSILQASLTRQFIVNLTQDGKALPEGPVVISPDGIFPSLYREVIRRAPHEFKIACLEDIRVLYPQDHNPFYAGFGNRETDEFSYLKVGIPRGKIFTINPKGQVVVNRRVDSKSYTSLHDLVHDMFPPTTVTEQEDYNNWNFWRLPPPDVGF